MTTPKMAKVREALDPIYLEAGNALYDCQQFEYTVAYLLFQLSRIGIPDIDKSSIKLILDGDSKKTAGQLVKMLKCHVSLGSDIDNTLEKALADRNYFIHKFLIKNVERMFSHIERPKLVLELQSLRVNIRTAIDTLDPIISDFMKRLDKIEYNEERIGDLFTFVESEIT
jgi:hypothetical protein